jgi:hypothetical protein
LRTTSSARRSFAAALLGVACFLFSAASVLAVPPLLPRQQYEALIAGGHLDEGRNGFRREIASLLDQLQAAPGAGSIEDLGRRALLVNNLALTVQAWAAGETRAVQANKAPSSEGALHILRDELLPLAQRIRDLRTAHDRDAGRLEGSLGESERHGAAWVFDAVRVSDEVRSRAPLALARLARIAGAKADVERVFDAFGGRIGKYGSAAEYLASPEEDRVGALGLTAQAVAPPALTPDAEAAIRSVISTYYQALTDRRPRRLAQCLTRDAPQARSMKHGLRTRRMAVGEIGRLSLTPQPDGSVRARVDDVAVTVRTEAGPVVQKGTQTFTLVLEDGQWKIREVGR